jgi:hypothetical protein
MPPLPNAAGLEVRAESEFPRWDKKAEAKLAVLGKSTKLSGKKAETSYAYDYHLFNRYLPRLRDTAAKAIAAAATSKTSKKGSNKGDSVSSADSGSGSSDESEDGGVSFTIMIYWVLLLIENISKSQFISFFCS